MHGDLPADIAALLNAGRGVFSVTEADEVGVSQSRLQRLAKSGALARVGRGVFASEQHLRAVTEWDAHAIRARGFVKACGAAFVCGPSTIAIRGIRRLGDPPALPVVVQPKKASRERGGSKQTRFGVIRKFSLPEVHRKKFAGCPVVSKTWGAVDYARTATRAEALVVADAVLADGATTVGMRRALAAMARWPGVEAAEWIVDHADGRSESVLESLGRLSCLEYDLPVPVSNAWVGRVHPEFRVDHLWPAHGVVAEADGAMKYRADDPAKVVAAEKERQWHLERELGLTVVRYGWDLGYGDRAQLAARFRAVLADNPPRSEPVHWWPIYDFLDDSIVRDECD